MKTRNPLRLVRRSQVLAAATAAFTGIAFGSAGVTRAADPTTEELLERVKALESEVTQLRTDHDKNTQDNTAQQVKEDAALRSQTLALNNVYTGFEPSAGFVIRSSDGNFSLRPGIVADFRNITNYRQNIPTGGGGTTGKRGDDLQNGFDVTRLRLTFDGTFQKNLGFFVQFQDDQGATFGLLDAFVTYKFDDSPFSIRLGQFKDPVWHERNLSEARLLTVDRSFTEALLGGGQTGRVQGVSLLYDNKDRLRGQFVIHDGFNTLNTRFYDAGGITTGVGGGAGVSPTNYGFSGRAEYLVLGDRRKDSDAFRQYEQFTALGDKQDIFIVGAGADYSQAGSNDVLFHTIDAQFNTASGLHLYAAYLGSYRNLHSNKSVAPGNYYDPGFQIQAAYLVNPKLEPFVRYDYTYLVGGSVSRATTHAIHEFTGGFNYYFFKQNVKFTLDATYLPNGAPTDSDALGILQNNGNNEFILRAQFQLAI